MPKHALLIAAVVLALCACGSPEPESSAEPSASTEQGAEDPVVDEPPADETEPTEAPQDEAPGAGSAVTVTRLSGTDTAPATGAPGTPVRATVSVEGAAVVVALQDFVTYCAPAPTFTAAMEGDALIVQAVRPENPTRCVGPHSARLQLDGVPAGEHTVRVRNTAGEEIASAQVAVGD